MFAAVISKVLSREKQPRQKKMLLVKWCNEVSGESVRSLNGYEVLDLRHVIQKKSGSFAS